MAFQVPLPTGEWFLCSQTCIKVTLMSAKQRSIVVSENNRQFEVIVPRKCDADKVHIDTADYETGVKRCDYAIRVTPTHKQFFYYVELKGSDVIKAAKQLVSTIEKRKTDYAGYVQKEAWVICSKWRPAVNTQFQKYDRTIRRFGFKLQHRNATHTISLIGKVYEPW